MARGNAVTIELSHFGGDPEQIRCEISFGDHTPSDWEGTAVGVVTVVLIQKLQQLGIIERPDETGEEEGGAGHA